MKKILWLPAWFPNRTDMLTGDFIERHAKAVSLNNIVHVLFILKDPEFSYTGKKYIENRIYNERLHATVIYYKAPFAGIKWLNRFFSGLLFYKYAISSIRQYFKKNGRPDLVHVHVVRKVGIIALYLRWFYKLSYVITEHWSGFYPQAIPNFNDYNVIVRRLYVKIMQRASGYTAVSHRLARFLKKITNRKEITIIPNVVDTSIFQLAPVKKNDIFRFMHISSLSSEKNIEEIIQGIFILSSLIADRFELIIYGPQRPELIKLTASLGIQDYILFKEETTQLLLAEDVKRSDAVILYSLYETFGCVVIEANACGLPVIVSDIPVFHENVIEGVTGVFVPLHQPQLLAEKMKWLMENKSSFNAQTIAAIAEEKYSFSVVSKQFDAFYEDILEKER